jgi:putative Mg2+ transporter-C (MgtC) family protein
MIEHYFGFIIKLILACVLGGIIGYERENKHRPAGFRTHILVCVGSALVMVTSEFIFNRYQQQVSIDPTRLGAQVISGIGFLGAGTIIREGFNVKGLTTAASLWSVSCVGIAAGIGFYEGAIAATVLIYITLIVLRKMEYSFSKKSEFSVLYIQSYNKPGLIDQVSSVLDKYEVPIKNIEFINNDNKKSLSIKVLLKKTSGFFGGKLASDLYEIDGVQKVIEE